MSSFEYSHEMHSSVVFKLYRVLILENPVALNCFYGPGLNPNTIKESNWGVGLSKLVTSYQTSLNILLEWRLHCFISRRFLIRSQSTDTLWNS